jgi:hypothetical protein
MKTLRLFVSLVPVLMFATALHAQAIDARVVSVKGSSTASRGTLQAGSSLGVGTLIRTGGDGEVTLRLFDGTVVAVHGDSELALERMEYQPTEQVRKEVTVLNLHRGTVVASLDPARKAFTSFSVRTPRGVAVAQGTVFAVRVTQDQANATVGTMSGVVTFITDRGEVTVGYGQVFAGSGVLTVQEAVAADPSLVAVFHEAALAIAEAIGSGAIVNTPGTPNLVAGVLAAVVNVAAQASPNGAGQLTQAVIRAVGPERSDLAGLVAQAASAGSPAAAAGNNPGTGRSGTILPSLDQVQVIVSPSRP